MRTRPALCLALAALLAAPTGAQSNVLLVVADDVGVDMLAPYGLGTDLPATPVIDQLASEGVLFRNAWSNPVCSPTRATILTGRYAFRTGIGYVVDATWALAQEEVTLPEALDLQNAGYAHAAIGKWHLANDLQGGLLAPNLAGFSHFAGTIGNVQQAGYFVWSQVENGASFTLGGYVTDRQADDAIEWIEAAPEPWFCYLAFQAAHPPFHAPPEELYQIDLSGAGDPATNPRPFYKAMIESMDHEIGRVLKSLGPKLANTTVVFVADNGTPASVTLPPFSPAHAKGTLYDGGIRVPLIVSGAQVTAKGQPCAALVNTTDLFATTLRLCGARPLPVSLPPPGGPGGPGGIAQPGYALPADATLDSISLVPYLTQPGTPSKREFAFAEAFKPLGPGPYTEVHRAIRGPRYKLIVDWPSPAVPEGAVLEQLFDLLADPFEQDDLLEHPTLTEPQQTALDSLRKGLKDILSS